MRPKTENSSLRLGLLVCEPEVEAHWGIGLTLITDCKKVRKIYTLAFMMHNSFWCRHTMQEKQYPYYDHYYKY